MSSKHNICHFSCNSQFTTVFLASKNKILFYNDCDIPCSYVLRLSILGFTQVLDILTERPVAIKQNNENNLNPAQTGSKVQTGSKDRTDRALCKLLEPDKFSCSVSCFLRPTVLKHKKSAHSHMQ